MTLINRKEAKAAGLTYYYTGRPCRNGHIEPRQVVSGGCIACRKDAAIRWRKKDNRMVELRQKQTDLRSNDLWYRARLLEGSRRNQCQGLIPPHYEQDACIEIYYKAVLLSLMTGNRYDVDHIIPIAAGGTHSKENLQIMTHAENLHKRRTDAKRWGIKLGRKPKAP